MNSVQEEMMLFDIFHHSHTWYGLFSRREDEKIPFPLPTILCRWYRLLSIWRYYHYIYDFYHCHAKLDFGLSDPFLLFFWSTVFSLRPEFLNLAVNSTFHRLGILPEDDFCISHSGAKRICEADFSFFIRHVLRTLVICFDSAFDTFCTATAAHTP